MGWCTAGSVLPHGVNVPLQSWFGNPSSNGVTINIPYGIDVSLTSTSLAPQPFYIRLAQTESDFIVTAVETGLGR